MQAASPTPPTKACLYGAGHWVPAGIRQHRAVSVEKGSCPEPFYFCWCLVSVRVCVLDRCLLTTVRGVCGNLSVQMKHVAVWWMEEQGRARRHPTVSQLHALLDLRM